MDYKWWEIHNQTIQRARRTLYAVFHPYDNKGHKMSIDTAVFDIMGNDGVIFARRHKVYYTDEPIVPKESQEIGDLCHYQGGQPFWSEEQ
jgi:hypothetical protein